MTKPRTWNAFKVTARTISRLDEGDLSLLMERLLKAQAYRCKAKLSEVIVNGEEKAKDDGSDGWSPRPEVRDEWLGDTETCWQFKAGKAGQAARLKGEVSKPIPAKTLRGGGRFVLVASQSTNGPKGQQDRLAALQREASSKKIPKDRIEVMCSEQIATWCNQHPVIAASLNGLPDGLWSLEKWEKSEVHRLDWHGTQDLQTKLEILKNALDLNEGRQWHVHIQGPPGVGKTRFVLELCRAVPWSESVVYFRQATMDPRLTELLDSAASDNQTQIVVVADEVEQKQIEPLNEMIRHGQGRVRLVTIGLERTPDARRIPAIEIAPLDQASARELVRSWFPTMPLEHRDFVAQFADGYTRLARLAAEAIMADPTVDLHDLLGTDAIKNFLAKMLGSRSRRALHVVAALQFVGWSDNKEDEGRAIAEHFELNWNDVRAEIEQVHRELGIAPQGGRFRYISPLPLGIYLALDAWETYPKLMETLDQKLPSEEARDAFYARMSAIAGSPRVSHFAKEAMSRFFREGALDDPGAIRRWAALAQASPAEAVGKMHDALSRKNVEQRRKIEGAARRELVSALNDLSWSSAAFHDGVRSLALLAEAENETWANNATESFIGKFQLFLGGTATPYQDRLAVVDELIDQGGNTTLALAAAALALIGNEHAARPGSGGLVASGAREPEWYPGSAGEEITCIKAALERLLRLANERHPGASAPLARAAKSIVLLLRADHLRPEVAEFFRKVSHAYPEQRGELWQAVDERLRREQGRKELSENALTELDALRSDLEDSSLEGRLRRLVGRTYSPRKPSDLSSIARILVQKRSTIAGEWAWLTSGEARGAWDLGEALARAAQDLSFASFLADLPDRGGDLRVLCGFLSRHAADAGQKELERWLDERASSHPDDSALLVEISWRCGVTEEGARRLASILLAGKADPRTVGGLVFGGNWNTLSEESFALLLEALTNHKEYGNTALSLLVRRLSEKPQENQLWKQLALRLLSRVDLIQARSAADENWEHLAEMFVSGHERALAGVLFRAHGDRSSKGDLLEHSTAGWILEKCAEGDPQGVWEELISYLENPRSAALFSIGFPRGIIEKIPGEIVLDWVNKDPEKRAPITARMMLKNLSSDETLAAQLLGRHGDLPSVRSAFLSAYMTGTWSGSAAQHWDAITLELEGVARRTALPKLRRWARAAAAAIRQVAQEDQRLEEERLLRSG